MIDTNPNTNSAESNGGQTDIQPAFVVHQPGFLLGDPEGVLDDRPAEGDSATLDSTARRWALVRSISLRPSLSLIGHDQRVLLLGHTHRYGRRRHHGPPWSDVAVGSVGRYGHPRRQQLVGSARRSTAAGLHGKRHRLLRPRTAVAQIQDRQNGTLLP